MAQMRFILKSLFCLSIWSCILLGLFKFHNINVIPEGAQSKSSAINGRNLLTKENRITILTSTISDRFETADVLVDNRSCKCSSVLILYPFLNSI